jgi:hypothetical protein
MLTPIANACCLEIVGESESEARSSILGETGMDEVEGSEYKS